MKKSIAILGIALATLALSTTVAQAQVSIAPAGVTTDKELYSQGEIVSITGAVYFRPDNVLEPINPSEIVCTIKKATNEVVVVLYPISQDIYPYYPNPGTRYVNDYWYRWDQKDGYGAQLRPGRYIVEFQNFQADFKITGRP